MPHSSKKAEVKLAKKVALGWRGKGTGIGQTVKGHKHERMLGAKYAAALPGHMLKEHDERVDQADDIMQNGQEERGHAQDAGTYQGMEGGKSQQDILFMGGTFANGLRRLVGRTGPNGPNKGLHDHDGQPICCTYIRPIRTQIPEQPFAFSFGTVRKIVVIFGILLLLICNKRQY